MDREGRPASPLVTRVKVSSAQSELPAIPHPVHFNLANQVALVGYDLARNEVRAGEELVLTLYWQAMTPLSHDYTVFTQMLDLDNQKVGQRDSQPRGGDYPTSLWDAGEVVSDVYVIPVSPDATSGGYRLVVGMYLLETGERLLVLNEQGEALDTMVDLLRIRVR